MDEAVEPHEKPRKKFLHTFVSIIRILFAFLTLLFLSSCSLGICLGWFGTGVKIAGLPFGMFNPDFSPMTPGNYPEARSLITFIFWPITLFGTWLLLLVVLLLAKRRKIAIASPIVAIAVYLVYFLLLNFYFIDSPGIVAVLLFLILNISVILFVIWLLLDGVAP